MNDMKFTYIELASIEGRETVLLGMEATPENVAKAKEIFGEEIEISLLK